MPLVSVIIPNYNHARYLPLRIESILNQTFHDFELIILDDKSTDESVELIKHYKALHPEIIISLNEKNSGSPFYQWFKGINLAQGDLIWIAESDDYADPNFIKILVQSLIQHPKVGLAYSRSIIIDKDGQVHPRFKSKTVMRWQEDFTGNGVDEVVNYISKKNTIPNASAVLFRKNLVKDFNYEEFTSFTLCGDWLFWIKILLKGDLAYSARTLNYFRKHDDSVTFDSVKRGVMILEAYRIIAFIKDQLSMYNFENVYDYWAQGWAGRFFSLSITYNLKIFKVAFAVDNKVFYRLLKFFLKRMYYKFGRVIGK